MSPPSSPLFPQILYSCSPLSFSLPPSFLSLLLSFLPLLPLFLRVPPSPFFHIKLFFIEAHAAWNSIPPGAAGWNTRLFWALAKQMLALGVPPETSLHAFLFFSLSLSLSLSLYLVSPSLTFMLFVSSLPSLCPWFPSVFHVSSFSWHFLTIFLCLPLSRLSVKGNILVS